MALVNRDSDYAIRALVELVREGRVLSVAKLAEASTVPVDYLRKIMQKLCHAGLVASVKGVRGGYRLDRVAEQLDMRTVVEAVQGRVLVNACFGDTALCEHVPTCPLRKRLALLQGDLDKWLAGTTLADVMADGTTENRR